MKFSEEKRDLFEYLKTYKEKPFYYAHCVSSDFALGKGIAKSFRKVYHLTNEQLINGKVDNTLSITSNVFNLITKSKYWQKPTYESLQKSLDTLKKCCISLSVKKLIMPKIGCGLDKLQWSNVKSMIKKTFNDLDIEIVICYL